MIRCGALACIGLLAAAAAATAQPRPLPRIDVAVGVAWNGGTTMTPLTATETTSNGTATALFAFDREHTSSVGVEARVGIRATRRLDVEAIGSYARPKLQLTASGDVEGAAPVTASEQLQEFTVGGAGLWYLRRRDASRTVPFVEGGVSYVRQLHETSTLADTGALIDFGAGVKRTLTTRRGTLKAVGVRADGRARIRTSALAVDGGAHVSPVLSASLFFRF